MKSNRLSLTFALALAAALSASPALAQHGNGHGNGKGKHESGEVRRDRDDDRGDRRRDDVRLERRSSRRVPPGWCIGRGNPHNTVANCGYRANHQYYDRRYDPRYSNNTGTYGSGRYNNTTSGSYAQQHAEFHRWHDAQCRELASRRPLDLSYQLQVRNQCKAEHDAWHNQMGVRHS